MAEVLPAPSSFEAHVETLVIGAGACGMVAALSAVEAGQDVMVLERDAVATGSTALSAGLIPAAGTRLQKAAGFQDSAALFAKDIQAKAKYENAPDLVKLMADGAAEVIDWLCEDHGLPFSLVADFDYPGHSVRRMHGLPSRSGAELIDALRSRCDALDIAIVCNAPVDVLYTDDRAVRGIRITRPDGTTDMIGCDRLILACNGFGGNPELVRTHMPKIADALWFGHSGNQGDALGWGRALCAQMRHLGAYQGHGNVAHPHGILISWAVITEGGIQVNRDGARFWDESQGYSEAARAVLSQPCGEAITIFDERIAAVARQFQDFRDAEVQQAVIAFRDLESLSASFGLDADILKHTIETCQSGTPDSFGRVFRTAPLRAPFFGVRVTGALFHTQGGLVINDSGRVLHEDGNPFPNLYAAGGAACGVSGSGDSGYLSGNGLLSAVVLGRRAGQGA